MHVFVVLGFLYNSAEQRIPTNTIKLLTLVNCIASEFTVEGKQVRAVVIFGCLCEFFASVLCGV